MSEIAIRVEGLSKQYRIGGPQARYKTLRESLVGVAQAPIRRAGRLLRGQAATDHQETIWALKDVSFEVKHGEVLGIIGRNGAGKSTLLKILSRITAPTEGTVDLYGRVGSLLEVGTGFHPELTGRENIYLNGAILGMKRAEIERKFDEMVAFAELEKFLDTPVKHYSSGMYVRLAFAVAANLDPEILLVDEVLAVGDAAFQKKCLGKMGEVAGEGRTVLFVSHNMAAILSLCSQAFLLGQGHILCAGAAEAVVTEHMAYTGTETAESLDQRRDRKGDGRVRLTSFTVENAEGNSSLRCSDRLRIRIGYASERELERTAFLIGIYDEFNRPIFFLDSETAGGLPEILPACGVITCTTSPMNITPGLCVVNVAIMSGSVVADHVKRVCTLEVEADDFYDTGKLPARKQAICLLRQDWQEVRDLGALNLTKHGME